MIHAHWNMYVHLDLLLWHWRSSCYHMWVVSFVNNGASMRAKNLSLYFLLFLLQITFDELVFDIILNTYPCTTIVWLGLLALFTCSIGLCLLLVLVDGTVWETAEPWIKTEWHGSIKCWALVMPGMGANSSPRTVFVVIECIDSFCLLCGTSIGLLYCGMFAACCCRRNCLRKSRALNQNRVK